MQLRREIVRGEFLNPTSVETEVEVRWDPLTDRIVGRMLRGANLLPPSDFDLEAFASETAQGCPFCTANLVEATPTLPARVHPEGRIRVGDAVLFPNLQTYVQNSSVCVYSPTLHHLPLDRITPRLMSDNLAAQVEFACRVRAADPKAVWVAISANHMLPSGSSLFHPHTQGSVDPHPGTMQALLAEVPAERFGDYLETERRLNERYLGSSGRVEWLAAFAPVGFNELRAFVPGLSSPEELGPTLVEELGSGIASALHLYAEMGYQSFNMALYGVPPGGGHMLNLRMVTRSNLKPLYRSDSTLFERLHWTAMVDRTPEDLAERAKGRFAG